MFLNPEDESLASEYLKQGYVIRPVEDKASLDWIRLKLTALSKASLNQTNNQTEERWLNHIHEKISVDKLNSFRLDMINGINSESQLRKNYFSLASGLLDALVGNELAMQLRVNLSVQMPNDDSSLLGVHADTWAGDSPYEVVVWLPLVDCYKTKSMYLLPPEANRRLTQEFKEKARGSSEELFRAIESEIVWLEVPYGHVLVFDQGLPHGNRVNKEPETRWSMNCRFKGVFTPYGDKKVGEFFEPITLRAASRIGMSYRLPEAQ